MKKVLFATTALIATAGIAAADGHAGIAITGSAEMGVSGSSAANAVTQFHTDVNVTFTMSGETDGGISYGAALDIEDLGANTNAVNSDADHGGITVFVSGDFGTLTMGDTDGGFDAGMLEVPAGPGGITSAHETAGGWNGFTGLDGLYDGQILSYSYSVSGFTITASVETDDDRERAAPVAPAVSNALFGELATQPAPDGVTGDAIYGIGAVYAGTFGGGSYNVGVGYQTVADIDGVVAGAQGYTVMGVSANVALDSGLSAGAAYSTYEGFSANNTGTHMAIGAAYSFDAITVGVNYGQYDWNAAANMHDTSGFGISAQYALGGGLNARLAYGSSSVDAINTGATAAAATLGNTNTWSLGLAMSF